MYPDQSPRMPHAKASIFVTLIVLHVIRENSLGKNAWEQIYSTGVIKIVVKSNCKFSEIYTLSVDDALKQWIEIREHKKQTTIPEAVIIRG